MNLPMVKSALSFFSCDSKTCGWSMTCLRKCRRMLLATFRMAPSGQSQLIISHQLWLTAFHQKLHKPVHMKSQKLLALEDPLSSAVWFSLDRSGFSQVERTGPLSRLSRRIGTIRRNIKRHYPIMLIYLFTLKGLFIIIIYIHNVSLCFQQKWLPLLWSTPKIRRFSQNMG